MGVSAFHKSLWPEIVRRYKAGDEMKAIAKDLGIDPKTVYNVARRAGLPNRHVFDDERTARILEAYESGTRPSQIAAAEGVHRTYVRNLARNAGLKPREEWGRKYPIDETAFDRPTPVGWWLVGLLAADGSVTQGNLITLTQRAADADVLHAFLEYVRCPDRPLTDLQLSPEASEQAAVWLGLLDGDGWVGEKGQRGRPLISFYGTPDVMRQCSAFWGARLEFQRVSAPTVREHASGLGSVCLHGVNAIQGAKVLLASSPVSLVRKRRRLEAIAAFGEQPGGSAPQRMRTSNNSNKRSE